VARGALAAGIARSSVVYAAGNIASAGLLFLLVPVYTRHLSPAEYGGYALVSSLLSLLLAFTDLGLTNAFARLHFDEKPAAPGERSSALYTTALVVSTAMGLAMAGLLVGVAPVAGPRWLEVPPDWLQLAAAIIVFQSLITIPMILLRATERAVGYSALLLVQNVLQVGFGVLFVARLGYGVAGVLAAQVVGTGTVAAIAVAATLPGSLRRPDPALVRGLLAFGLPFVPVLVLNWVVDVSDRVLLDRLVDREELGLYALGYRFGQLMSLLVSGFTLGWGPARFKILGEADAPARYARVAEVYAALAAGAWMLAALSYPWLIPLLVSGPFEGADRYAAPVAFGYVLYGFFVLASTGQGATRRTGSVPLVVLAAAIANIVLNLAFIPWMGAMAAAYSTVASFALMTGGTLYFSQRLYPIPYAYGRILACLAAAIVLVGVAGGLAAGGSLGLRLGVTAVAAAVYAVVAAAALRTRAPLGTTT
jgi:O-antigen/teichoic acid export membrane protein